MIPSYYDSSQCGKLRKPNLDAAVEAGKEFARKNKIKSSANYSGPKITLAVIDMQIDFISPDVGNLCVPGAVADVDRLCRYIYNNVEIINDIDASLDSHYLFQPFHKMNWQAGPNPTTRTSNGKLYQIGDNPEPFTLINLSDLDKGIWLPTRRPEKSRKMLSILENTHKKKLCIWPFHCILGTPGHAFDPSFMEAMFYHAACKNIQYNAAMKGMSSLSEHYGILQSEVQFPEDPNTQLNVDILRRWEVADLVVYAGQAESHCVLETLNQVVSNFQNSGKNELLAKMQVLRDCMSSVPDIKNDAGDVIVPFKQIALNRFEEMKTFGVKFVNSTDPVKL